MQTQTAESISDLRRWNYYYFSFLGGLMHFCPNLSCTISAKLKLEILNLLSICCRSDKVVLFSRTNWYWMFETFYVSETFTQKLDWNCFKFYRNARSRGRRKRRKLQKKNRFCFWVHARGFKKVCVQLSYCVMSKI